MKKLGALWTGKTKDKETYLNGTIEIVAGMPTKIVVFKNKAKPGAKPLSANAPQYQIYLSEPMKAERASEETFTTSEDLE